MLVLHEFGPEGAAYVRTYLEAHRNLGKRFGRLWGDRDIGAGKIWAYVPAERSEQQRIDFEHGGLYPSGRPIRAEEGMLVPKFNPVSNPQITGALTDLLGEEPNGRGVLLVELAYARSTDARFAQRVTNSILFCDDDAYAYGTLEGGIEPAIRHLGGATWEPNVGVVTTLPVGVQLAGGSVGSQELAAMASAATTIIVGAWDAEGLLFWTPRGLTNRPRGT